MTNPAGPGWDDLDQSILDRLEAVHQLLDPPPPELAERVRFALSLDAMTAEVARLRADVLIGSGARGSERTRTITFEAESRTVMITIVDRPGGLVRLDGWLAPATPLRVELRLPEPARSQVVTCDETGRFVFDRVPRGLAQLLVYPPGNDSGPGGGALVVTPSLAL
jgi:hypothetical protein